MSDIRWTAEQSAACNERRAELAVSAAAGSGKTAVLIERVRRAALGISRGTNGQDRCDPASRVSLDRLLAVTFTRAAAAELRARLQEALATAASTSAGADSVPAAVVRAQLAALPRAQISTIHSFCGEVVRRYGHLRGISHDRVMDEDEAALLRHDLATKYLDERLGTGADAALRELALAWGGADGIGPDDLSRTRFSGGLRTTMLSLLAFRRALPDPGHWYATRCKLPDLDPGHCDPGHPLVSALAAEFDEWVAEQTTRDQLSATALAADYPGAQFIELAGRRKAQLDQLRFCQGWDRLAGFIETRLLHSKQDDIKYKPELLGLYRRDIPKDDPWYERTQVSKLKEGLQDWRELFSEPWADVARRDNETKRLTAALWELAGDFDTRYSDYKRGRGIADFDDMQRDALTVLAVPDPRDADRLLRDTAGRVLPSTAALELRRRFEMVLVDEHQDTNELQDTLIDLVTRDAPAGNGGGRPRFFVGDLKQSIYTFRQAVPQLFSAARDRLEATSDTTGRHIKLQVNFRSRPRLLSAVNQVFDGLMTRELGGEDYGGNRLLAPEGALALSAGYPGEQADRPAELHLVVGSAEATATAGDDQGDGSEADAEPGRLETAYTRLALILLDLHGSQALIRDKREGFRRVKWRDIAVLMRSTANRVETLLSVFARCGIPVYAAGRSGFYERPEVADALSLLRIIDNPRQDIPLAAVLHGPVLGLDGAELLRVARSIERTPDGPPPGLWDRLQAFCTAAQDSALKDRLCSFLKLLAGWRDLARLVPVPELLWRVYSDTGLPAAAAAQPGGEQRCANLLRLHDLARQSAGFERQGLARFLRTLELSRRAAGDLGEAPVLTEAQDVVRVMTIHQSKGLEFPVVAIPDVDKAFNLRDLAGDVLWHRSAGIGGRHIDWHAPEEPGNGSDGDDSYNVPERHKTLSYRRVQTAARNESVAEELRVLYVALTRARERLILTGTIDRGKQGNLRTGKDGTAARCWLDWLATQLGTGIAAADTTGEPALCGTEDCWRVSLHPAEAGTGTVPDAAGAEPQEQLTAADLAIIRSRLKPDYACPGSRLLKAKLTVTRLSHLPPSDRDDDGLTVAVPVTKRVMPAPVVLPGFMQAGMDDTPVPIEYGTAVHLLMAQLDLTGGVDTAVVADTVSRLVDSGHLRDQAAKLIDPATIASAAQDVKGLFDPAGVELFPELPISMLVPGDDELLLGQLRSAGLDTPEPGSGAPEDRVYVQGVLDLLAVDSATITVVDYKTDRGAGADELQRRYRQQLEWYCRMVEALIPGKSIQWVIYGMDQAGIVGPVEYGQ